MNIKTEEIKTIIKNCNLSCNVREFKDKVDWDLISKYQHLSESFIREFKDYVDWYDISQYQHLSENFIREFKDYVKWNYISIYQHLSEDFIRKFEDKVDWINVSKYQHLSEDFIRKFKDNVDWYHITKYQHLSESFIREFKDYVYWYIISKYQHLSENFIREFKDYINWYDISTYQHLSEDFIREFKLTKPKNNWLYFSEQDKINYIKKNTDYKIKKDINGKYILAYKGIRKNNYSCFNFRYYYEIGKTYTSHCDCNLDSDNSFGLSAWTLDKAKEYCNEKILLVKIYIKDIGAIIKDGNKIRCFKQTIIKEII